MATPTRHDGAVVGLLAGAREGAEAVGVHGDERCGRRGPDAAAVRGGIAVGATATMGRRGGRPASVGATAAVGGGRRPTTVRAAAAVGRRSTVAAAAAAGGRGRRGGPGAAAVGRGSAVPTAAAAGRGGRRRGAEAAVGRGRQRRPAAVRRRWHVPTAAAVGRRRRPGGASASVRRRDGRDAAAVAAAADPWERARVHPRHAVRLLHVVACACSLAWLMLQLQKSSRRCMYVPWLAFSALDSTTATKACVASAASTKLARRALAVLRASIAAPPARRSLAPPLL